MFCNTCSGEPTACSQMSASVTLAKCLLDDHSIDYSALHLNDQACKGEMDNVTHMVTFSFDSTNTCGTVVMVSVLYKLLNLLSTSQQMPSNTAQ